MSKNIVFMGLITPHRKYLTVTKPVREAKARSGLTIGGTIDNDEKYHLLNSQGSFYELHR
jgi:hypothetical protein